MEDVVNKCGWKMRGKNGVLWRWDTRIGQMTVFKRSVGGPSQDG